MLLIGIGVCGPSATFPELNPSNYATMCCYLLYSTCPRITVANHSVQSATDGWHYQLPNYINTLNGEQVSQGACWTVLRRLGCCCCCCSAAGSLGGKVRIQLFSAIWPRVFNFRRLKELAGRSCKHVGWAAKPCNALRLPAMFSL